MDYLNRRSLDRVQRIERMVQTIASRCLHEGISLEALTAGSKAGSIPRVRSDLARQVFDELGLSYAEIGRGGLHIGSVKDDGQEE